MDLERVISDIADALKPYRFRWGSIQEFPTGVGPYGEPQLLRLVCKHLNSSPHYAHGVKTKRSPDLLISGLWELEVKIVRPFGDNGKPAENWSVNLLHPYDGNTSLLGDCLKLCSVPSRERKGVIAIGYEHNPPKISLEPLLRSFEVIAAEVLSISLSERVSATRTDLVHPVHQRLTVIGWELG